MNMNNIRRILRILACMVILCFTLTSAGFGVQPVQASPPTSGPTYWLDVWFSSNPPSLCLNKKTELEFTFRITSRMDVPSLVQYRFAGFQLGSRLAGTELSMRGKAIPEGPLEMDKEYRIKFDYTPGKVGQETLTLILYVKVGPLKQDAEKAHLSFPVKGCGKYKVRGSADLGKMVNTMMPMPGWEYLGTYDIFGEVSVEEESIHGEGTATTSQVFLWTGEAPDAAGLTCVQESPWEGTTEVEMDADLAAFADAGTLNFQFYIGPLSFNTTEMKCVDSEGGYGGFPMPGTTLEAYTLPIEPIPAEGGHLLIADEGFEMDLFVMPEMDS
jgi:hypothetical protein